MKLSDEQRKLLLLADARSQRGDTVTLYDVTRAITLRSLLRRRYLERDAAAPNFCRITETGRKALSEGRPMYNKRTIARQDKALLAEYATTGVRVQVEADGRMVVAGSFFAVAREREEYGALAPLAEGMTPGGIAAKVYTGGRQPWFVDYELIDLMRAWERDATEALALEGVADYDEGETGYVLLRPNGDEKRFERVANPELLAMCGDWRRLHYYGDPFKPKSALVVKNRRGDWLGAVMPMYSKG